MDNEDPDQSAQSAQTDPGLRCPLPELLNLVERIDEQRRSRSDLAGAQADLAPMWQFGHFLAMLIWCKIQEMYVC